MVAGIVDIAEYNTVKTLASSSDAWVDLNAVSASGVSDSVAPGIVRQLGNFANAFEGGPTVVAGRPRRAGSICDMSYGGHKKNKQTEILDGSLKASYFAAKSYLAHTDFCDTNRAIILLLDTLTW